MNKSKDLVVSFISWLQEYRCVTLEEWYGPECETVSTEDIEKFFDEYLEEMK